MKSYTDLEQSKKLAEILPLESADMWWNYYSITTDFGTPQIIHLNTPWVGSFNWYNEPDNTPCWSLAALLSVLTENKICHYDDRYYCQYISEGGEFPTYSTAEYDNPVDACVSMIEKLHELKML